MIGPVNSSFAPMPNSSSRPQVLTRILPPAGCDLPENGGITGKKEQKPNPWILEERPTTIDPRTGQRVYVDQIKLPYVKY